MNLLAIVAKFKVIANLAMIKSKMFLTFHISYSRA